MVLMEVQLGLSAEGARRRSFFTSSCYSFFFFFLFVLSLDRARYVCSVY